MVSRMASHGEQDDGPGARVPFGAQDVDAAEKPALVGRIFNVVAGRYDLMNDLMSLGVHRLWRRAAVAALGGSPGEHVLDLAGGTGDIAARLVRKGRRVTVCDINPAMLQQGRRRLWDRGLVREPVWGCGDAEALPFPRGVFDAAVIAFGIRNVTHLDRALAETARVLKPGGRFVCLEFGPEATPAIAPAYKLWSRRVIPALGEAVTGNRAAYEYLVESIRRFPPSREFAALMTGAGYAGVRATALSGGIAWLHGGWRV